MYLHQRFCGSWITLLLFFTGLESLPFCGGCFHRHRVILFTGFSIFQDICHVWPLILLPEYQRRLAPVPCLLGCHRSVIKTVLVASSAMGRPHAALYAICCMLPIATTTELLIGVFPVLTVWCQVLSLLRHLNLSLDQQRLGSSFGLLIIMFLCVRFIECGSDDQLLSWNRNFRITIGVHFLPFLIWTVYPGVLDLDTTSDHVAYFLGATIRRLIDLFSVRWLAIPLSPEGFNMSHHTALSQRCYVLPPVFATAQAFIYCP